jgi:NhaP-type Na+/H+ or K+/H+ antiporter
VNGWRSRVIEALVLLLTVAVVARVVWNLLGPLLPVTVVMVTIGGLLFGVIRGPHGGH